MDQPIDLICFYMIRTSVIKELIYPVTSFKRMKNWKLAIIGYRVIRAVWLS